MKRLFLGAVASFVLVAAGLAGASAQAPVTTNWSGLYLGVNGTFQSNNVTQVFPSDGTQDGNFGPFAGGTFSQHANGNGFGGQVGFNAQHGRFVYGVDLAYDQNNQVVDSINNLGPNATGAAGGNIDYQSVLKSSTLATVRLGIANNSTFYYVKGGAALGRFTSNMNAQVFTLVSSPPPVYSSANYSFNQTHVVGGYTYGAGADWAFDAKNPNVTAGIEYDYTKFNNVAFGGLGTPDNTWPIGYTFKNVNLSEVLVRLSYKLP